MNNNFRFDTNFNNPILYDVIFLNDPITTMEFVERVLRDIFGKKHKQAVKLTQKIHELRKITIAALPGAAAGAGLSIALACDLRVASVNAFLTTAFGNIGLSGDYGASWFLPRLIGLSKAKEMFYTSSRIGAEECERLGLFNKIFPVDTFREEVNKRALFNSLERLIE